jgi:hypothetical protein
MSSGVETFHPQYAQAVSDWELMDDSYHGERRVKSRTYKYLPATPGQIIDGLNPNQKGRKNYHAYLTRGRFPSFVSDAVEALLGVMHFKPATIELPESMETLRNNATIGGENLQMLLRRINEHQLIAGRLGLLADIEDGAEVGVLPYIAVYKAKDIPNWDDISPDVRQREQLNLVVLNESRYERDRLVWKLKKRYRVLMLNTPDEIIGQDPKKYRMAVIDSEKGTDISAANIIEPSVTGRTLEELPFAIVNSRDLCAQPDDPPLLALANLAMAVYRGEADYRQAIFMQGQDTLVIIGGGDDEVRAGAGAHIDVPMGGDAKYIGTDSKGLKEMRESLQNDRKEAAESGGKLLDTRHGNAESGEALKVRVGARTASLTQIAITGAAGLQEILRKIAAWIGADPEKVIVTPNMDFVDAEIQGRELVDWMSAKMLGLPLSKKSIHKKLQDRDMTELEFEEEMTEIETEAPEPGGEGTGIDDDDENIDDDGGNQD